MTIEEAKQKVVSLAISQVGYREGSNNYNKYADNPDITKLYGWNVQNQPWCCTFVNWCFLTAFGYDVGSRLTYGGTAACNASANLYKQNAAWVTTPQIGDQAFFYSGSGINHTGIVVAVEGTQFTTVEGNYSDKVSEVRHNVGRADVAGFGRPDWKIVEGADSIPSNDDPTPPISVPGDYVKHTLEPPLLKTSSSYNTYCVLLQALLNCRKFACGSADGFYGAKTQAAVHRFQEWAFPDDKSQWDGICGPQTWKKLLETG